MIRYSLGLHRPRVTEISNLHQFPTPLKPNSRNSGRKAKDNLYNGMWLLRFTGSNPWAGCCAHRGEKQLPGFLLQWWGADGELNAVASIASYWTLYDHSSNFPRCNEIILIVPQCEDNTIHQWSTSPFQKCLGCFGFVKKTREGDGIEIFVVHKQHQRAL